MTRQRNLLLDNHNVPYASPTAVAASSRSSVHWLINMIPGCSVDAVCWRSLNDESRALVAVPRLIINDDDVDFTVPGGRISPLHYASVRLQSPAWCHLQKPIDAS